MKLVSIAMFVLLIVFIGVAFAKQETAAMKMCEKNFSHDTCFLELN